MRNEVDIHPAANIFPMMSTVEFEQLKQDIKDNHQQSPITYWGGKLLDGRNRYRACKELGIDPLDEELDETIVIDPYQWVISQNLHRRHLDASQRSMIAAKMATLKNGEQKRHAEPIGSASLDDAAQILSVGRASVVRAKHVIEHGAKQLIEAVEKREVKVALAENLCKVCPDKKEQSALVKSGPKAIRDHVKQIKDAKPPEKEKPSLARKSLPELVVAFRHSNKKADDLRVLIEELDSSFRQLIATWIADLK